ncbi:DUF2892 domain-containing protein [Sphingomonas sp. KRR8]|uniref:YgaP family membrane protein n=1 Tax=Sphingomonas sp. KRR8 TaxID=2942996 RepID=UPI0020212174|nr:DUF2892 domain-containing protein [Sphingomonas sp. KRR8]URD60649.1 DUF2892 domain-containing protein [Sphingomonas sp. KRR8]
MFARNEGPFDRSLRIAVGLVILSLAFVGPKTPWAFVGLIPLVTGLVGTCPLYSLLGFSTGGPRS